MIKEDIDKTLNDKELLNKIEVGMLKLGFVGTQCGAIFFKQMVAISLFALCNNLPPLRKNKIYCELALRSNVQPNSIERDIRHSVYTASRRGIVRKTNAICGFEVLSDRPTITEMLFAFTYMCRKGILPGDGTTIR